MRPCGPDELRTQEKLLGLSDATALLYPVSRATARRRRIVGRVVGGGIRQLVPFFCDNSCINSIVAAQVGGVGGGHGGNRLGQPCTTLPVIVGFALERRKG